MHHQIRITIFNHRLNHLIMGTPLEYRRYDPNECTHCQRIIRGLIGGYCTPCIRELQPIWDSNNQQNNDIDENQNTQEPNTIVE